jgi:hypothetical protein
MPKNSTPEEMLTLCGDNGNIIQPVVACNHTAMCRIESYGVVVHSRGSVGMLNASFTLRFHGGAVLNFCIKSLRFSRDYSIVDTPWEWMDSDWAGHSDTRRSNAAYIIMMNGGPISWKSRRQNSVALSTSEAEYMAASEVGKEILYRRAILRDVGHTQTAPTNIYQDNLASIAVYTDPVRRKSSRQIDIRVHFCRQLWAAGVMRLVPLRTHLMVADALTNSPPGPVVTQHREVVLGLLEFSVGAFLSRMCSPCAMEFNVCGICVRLSTFSESLLGQNIALPEHL